MHLAVRVEGQMVQRPTELRDVKKTGNWNQIIIRYV